MTAYEAVSILEAAMDMGDIGYVAPYPTTPLEAVRAMGWEVLEILCGEPRAPISTPYVLAHDGKEAVVVGFSHCGSVVCASANYPLKVGYEA